MPLLKGQGCKSKPDKAIAYITDVSKAAYVSSQYLFDDEDYAKQMRDTAKICGKGEKYGERKYYHFKLSCAQSDRVTAASHHDYAVAMAARLFREYECVIATHIDTATIHSHIIVNAVSFVTEKKLHCNNQEYGRMKDLVNEIGMERGFTPLDWRGTAARKKQRIACGEVEPMKQTEKYMQLSEGWEKRSWKEKLRRLIDDAKKSCCNRQELQDFMAKSGVDMPRNTAKSISFKPNNIKKSVRGQTLGEAYTVDAIDGALKNTFERLHNSKEKSSVLKKLNENKQILDDRGNKPGEREYELIAGAIIKAAVNDYEKRQKTELNDLMTRLRRGVPKQSKKYVLDIVLEMLKNKEKASEMERSMIKAIRTRIKNKLAPQQDAR